MSGRLRASSYKLQASSCKRTRGLTSVVLIRIDSNIGDNHGGLSE